MDTIYVIYLDGKMYTENNRKCAYLLYSQVEAVIDSESRKVAHDMFKETNTRECWYEIGEVAKQEYIDKAKERFEIREFVERRTEQYD